VKRIVNDQALVFTRRDRVKALSNSKIVVFWVVENKPETWRNG
jgi:hypothetical protein